MTEKLKCVYCNKKLEKDSWCESCSIIIQSSLKSNNKVRGLEKVIVKNNSDLESLELRYNNLLNILSEIDKSQSLKDVNNLISERLKDII